MFKSSGCGRLMDGPAETTRRGQLARPSYGPKTLLDMNGGRP
jgi:hypothetical protein